MGVTDQRHPVAAALLRLICIDDALGVVIHHLLPEGFLGVFHAVYAVARHAVDGPDADTVFSCGLEHGHEGVLAGRVSPMAFVQRVDVVLKARRHLARSRKRVQVRLMEVGHDVLHVQGFDLELGEQGHLLDQELFAAHARVTLADHQPWRAFVQQLENAFQWRIFRQFGNFRTLGQFDRREKRVGVIPEITA